MEKEKRATITIYEIRCALSTQVALGKMSQEESDKFVRLLHLDQKEEDYVKKEEANFFKELQQFYEKWDMMLSADIGPEGRVEYIVGAFGNRSFYHPKGLEAITADDVSLLPKIAKRQQMFNKVQLNETVHIDDIRPILQAITRVEVGSWCYVTDDDFKTMIEDLKVKYNLSIK